VRLARLTQKRAERGKYPGTRQARAGNARLPGHPALARPPFQTIIKERIAAVKSEFATPRKTVLIGAGRRVEDGT